MKQLFLKLNLAFVAIMLMLATGCTGEDNAVLPPTLDDLPHYVRNFLNDYLPGETAEKITVADQNTQVPVPGVKFMTNMSNGVGVGFDEDGYWQCAFSDGDNSLPESLTRILRDSVRNFIAVQFPGETITGIHRTGYGECILLSDMQKLAFQTQNGQFIGYDYTANENHQREKIKEFVYTHFPESSIDYYTEYNGEKLDETEYYIGTTNGFALKLDSYGNWTRIEGGKQIIPESIIADLPGDLLNKLVKSYPNAEITLIEKLNDTDYNLKVGKSKYYLYTPSTPRTAAAGIVVL